MPLVVLFIIMFIYQRSTLQVPGHDQSGLVWLNTLNCPVEIAVAGGGIAPIEQYGTALMTPVMHRNLALTASCPHTCAGRVMKKQMVQLELRTIAGMVFLFIYISK